MFHRAMSVELSVSGNRLMEAIMKKTTGILWMLVMLLIMTAPGAYAHEEDGPQRVVRYP
jgi:hypothetical protein